MTRINKVGPTTHFTKEMDDFFLKKDDYETWSAFASAFKTNFARFANNDVVGDLTRERLVMKLRARDQFLKKMEKEAK